jgi:hypothetical protein
VVTDTGQTWLTLTKANIVDTYLLIDDLGVVRLIGRNGGVFGGVGASFA